MFFQSLLSLQGDLVMVPFLESPSASSLTHIFLVFYKEFKFEMIFNAAALNKLAQHLPGSEDTAVPTPVVSSRVSPENASVLLCEHRYVRHLPPTHGESKRFRLAEPNHVRLNRWETLVFS